MSDRVTVYRFGATNAQVDAAFVLIKLLEARGLHPWFVYEPIITLPAGEAERLRELQRAEPQTFGGC